MKLFARLLESSGKRVKSPEEEHAETMAAGHEEVSYDHQFHKSISDREAAAHMQASGEHEHASGLYHDARVHFMQGRVKEGHSALKNADRQSAKANKATERAEHISFRERDKVKQKRERAAAKLATKAAEGPKYEITAKYKTGSGTAIWRKRV